ncbi:MAG: potassium transporter Kup [Betaproteobacteria bacterium]|nr:potassium transporter Kup [Betaproteobacteria bacterium]
MAQPTPNGRSPVAVLTLAALGVVFGDIGTSPLYAFKEAFSGTHGLPLTEANVLAALSMMFWSITLIVSLKYVSVVLRFDNGGEGGILALLALALRLTRDSPQLAWTVAVLGIFGASLFFGDAIITPAISVLSAVEGLSVATPAFERWVVPITLAILIGLFGIQSHGTGAVGRLFGPITVLWFVVVATLGALSIEQTPAVLAAFDPRHALGFALKSPGVTFLVLGAVFLAMTGAEALYADMGHFGPFPIRLAWFGLVFPSLMLNYFGQGALLLRDPAAMRNPFYLLAPQDLLLPLVVLATVATVIASQAVISGAFSVTQQASRLGYLPRLPTLHTSETERGQVYVAQVNWTMLVLVMLLVLAFKSSSAIASAYGIAVSGTMVLDTALIAIVAFSLPGRPNLLFLALLALVGSVELVFFASNATKFVEGGWFPLSCGLALFVIMTTWKRAQSVLAAHSADKRVPVEDFRKLFGSAIPRVPGTAIYLAADPKSVPTVLMHNLKHNKVLHERVIFLSVTDADVPRVPNLERAELSVIEPRRLYQATLRYGFMEAPDVPKDLGLFKRLALEIDPAEATFFLGKSTIAKAAKPGLFTWRRELFRWMQRNSPSAAESFKLPPDRVVELGTRITL